MLSELYTTIKGRICFIGIYIIEDISPSFHMVLSQINCQLKA